MKSKQILMLGAALVSLNSLTNINDAAAATATISLTATTNLHFGRFAPNATSAGTVIISSAGAQTFTGGIVDGGSIGIAQAAGFVITSDPSVDIQITAAPSSLTGPGPAMALSTIKYSVGPLADTDTTTFQVPAATASSFPFTVGGTLSVANAGTQTLGIYLGGITLTANYL